MHAERKPPPPDSACACLLPSCAAKLSGTSKCAHIVNFLQNFDYAACFARHSGNGGGDRLERARGHVDDEAADAPKPHLLQVPGDGVNVPGLEKGRARVEGGGGLAD